MERGHNLAADMEAAGVAKEGARPGPVEMQSVSGDAVIIVNADDWGLNAENTERIFKCACAGVLSSVSAMVFMEVSESSAALAREHGVDAGVHLNFTTEFTGSDIPPVLRDHHRRVISYLRRWRIFRALFNPLLMNSFDYVAKAQLEEFARLYGAAPRHLDGHHHMHLCANVLLQKLLPEGAMVRRSKSSLSGERSLADLCYRGVQDRMVRRRHQTAEYFFDLLPIEHERLKRILELGREADVELSVHPSSEEEFHFLMNAELGRYADRVVIARDYRLRSQGARLDEPVRDTTGGDAGSGATHA